MADQYLLQLVGQSSMQINSARPLVFLIESIRFALYFYQAFFLADINKNL